MNRLERRASRALAIGIIGTVLFALYDALQC